MKGEVKQAFIISYCEKAISAYSAVCQVADGNLDLLAVGDYETLGYASFHSKSFCFQGKSQLITSGYYACIK